MSVSLLKEVLPELGSAGAVRDESDADLHWHCVLAKVEVDAAVVLDALRAVLEGPLGLVVQSTGWITQQICWAVVPLETASLGSQLQVGGEEARLLSSIINLAPHSRRWRPAAGARSPT